MNINNKIIQLVFEPHLYAATTFSGTCVNWGQLDFTCNVCRIIIPTCVNFKQQTGLMCVFTGICLHGTFCMNYSRSVNTSDDYRFDGLLLCRHKYLERRNSTTYLLCVGPVDLMLTITAVQQVVFLPKTKKHHTYLYRVRPNSKTAGFK